MQHRFCENLPILLKQPVRPIELVYFDASQFRTPASEETLSLGYGAKYEYADLFAFWLNFLRARDWTNREQYFQPYLETAVWISLSETAWRERIQTYTAELQAPLPAWFKPDRPIEAAWQVFDEWHDQAAVAEYADIFIAFHWETTA